MNKIRDDFPPNIKDFFVKLQNYLDTDLYFYGSVNRSDYVHGKSDIDVAIFTDNEYSTMAKLQHFLRVKRSDFDKVVWKLEGKMIYGYKIKCDKHIHSRCEIAIYNNDFKKIWLDDVTKHNKIPFHISILLFILKTLHYTFPILSPKTYSTYKRYVFNTILDGKKDTVFFLLKSGNYVPRTPPS
jgi:predicted nucleotidyltransferase